jgi:hypothetical protein
VPVRARSSRDEHAVGVGSRGIANIAECTKHVIAELKALGAQPFVFPAIQQRRRQKQRCAG